MSCTHEHPRDETRWAALMNSLATIHDTLHLRTLMYHMRECEAASIAVKPMITNIIGRAQGSQPRHQTDARHAGETQSRWKGYSTVSCLCSDGCRASEQYTRHFRQDNHTCKACTDCRDTFFVMLNASDHSNTGSSLTHNYNIISHINR